MSSVYMIVFTVGLAVQILAATGCENGNVRFDPNQMVGPHEGSMQLCCNNQWRTFCDQHFNRVEANVICKQLGYIGSAKEKKETVTMSVSNSAFLIKADLQACTGHERSIEECQLTKVSACTSNKYNLVECLSADCTTGSLRLVGGASYREGRVEVCVDGRWGTVCYNEELAGTVCQQLGFGSQESENKTQIHRLKFNCSFDHKIELSCTNETEQEMCPGLKIKCQQRLYNENCTEDHGKPTDPVNTSCPTAALSVLVGLLTLAVVLLSGGILLYTVKHKSSWKQQQRESTQTNENYTTTTPPAAAEPSYSELGPQYDVLKRDEPPKIEPYQPVHPPPVGGVSDDEFYNAEGHTYAVVPKKNKIKKQKGGAN